MTIQNNAAPLSTTAIGTLITAQTLTQFCDNYLSAAAFKDYAPNGLQVDGGQPIQRIVTGVTACEALIDAAIAINANAIMVHHGYFWKGEPEPIVGIKGQRIRKLLQHGISLIAYHLPLDAHSVIGNNAKLAEMLGLTITGALYPNETHPVGNIATCAPQSADSLIATINHALGRAPLHIAADYIAPHANQSHTHTAQSKLIERVGLCSGGAQDMIEQAAAMGCDAYISGEISERTTHSARELGIDYFACGHHATERGGIQALGELVAQHFDIPVTFIDIDNPA
ncbi:Nif3-like dinuclear metal center hexameric protein [Psychrobacter urativorans]|uniref:Metal-binding protein n=1 Tax=Psychrobacter urativorans TaxID=45610 RepID=A0A0M4TDM9_9GAMM|nr:Nif3-like dinuclear metal center hexameric protein [Psychrobacter urativorans]ALF58979.1 metal-binding protein [Psychrobacter urativorans]